MPTTIRFKEDAVTGRSVSFMSVYNWLLANVGQRLAWRTVQITGEGWRIITVSMLGGGLIVEIDDDQKAMLFVLQFGGEVDPPEDLDIEWQKS